MAAVTSIVIAAEGAKNDGTLEFLRRPAGRLLIDGKWMPARSGKTFTGSMFRDRPDVIAINPLGRRIQRSATEKQPVEMLVLAVRLTDPN